MDTKLKIRSKKMRRGAEGQRCTYCGCQDGTIVGAHYQGFRSHQFGKGTGTKPHDLCIADLCFRCHTKFDMSEISTLTDPILRRIDESEQFMFCVLMTIIRRAKQGILYTDDMSLGGK